MENIEFVAEFTTNPMGNLNLLLKMVQKASDAGCTWIKMQKKDVTSFYTKDKLESPYISPYGKTYGEYRELFEFDKESFSRFHEECKKYGIRWFVTVQDILSLEFMLTFDLPMYKVASLNVGNDALLASIVSSIPKDKYIVISVAGASLDRIERTLNMLNSFKRIYLLHCVAEYPCPDICCKLGNIGVLRKHFESENIIIGYSGHEEGYLPSIAAVSLGAKMVERHFCISRTSFVHHIECSLEPEEYRELIRIVRLAKDSMDLIPHFAELRKEAFSTSFSMSVKEREFLIEQKYGKKYLGDHSIIN